MSMRIPHWSRNLLLFIPVILVLLAFSMQALLTGANSAHAQSAILLSTNEAGYYVGDGSTLFDEASAFVTVPCIQSGTSGSTLAIMISMGGVYDNGVNSFSVGFLDKPNNVIQPFYSYSKAATVALNPVPLNGSNFFCGDRMSLSIVINAGQLGYTISDLGNTAAGHTGYIDNVTHYSVDAKSVGMFVARNYCPSVGSGGSYSPLTQFSTVSWSSAFAHTASNRLANISALPLTKVTMVDSKNRNITLATTSGLSDDTSGSKFTNTWIKAGPSVNSAC